MKLTIVRKKIPEKLYEEINRLLPVVCVDLVVIQGGAKRKRFLMLKRTNFPKKGEWWFPGGRVLKNERLKKAAVRLLKKETGVRGKIGELMGSWEHFEYPSFYPHTIAHRISFVFLARIPGDAKMRLDRQSADWRFFDAVNPAWRPYVKEFLGKAGFKIRSRGKKKRGAK